MTTGSNPQSQQAKALELIRRMINHGDLAAGTMLSENQLATKLHMSRTPVRAALAVLEREGLVETLPQRGVRVRKIPHEEMREIFVLRKEIETLVATELAKTTRDVTSLDKNIEKTEKAAGAHDEYEFLEVSTEFHYLIAKAAGFLQAAGLLETLRSRLRLLGIQMAKEEGYMTRAITEHRGIRDAIAAGDLEGVERLMKTHLDHTYDGLARAASQLDANKD
ncbi:MAG TPA: GntR family transcriptional regulator [Candidatus Paceibacterota bacterium]|nr:GntR family transcriptional regulator [Candidatus Paceibacterota bacterium]